MPQAADVSAGQLLLQAWPIIAFVMVQAITGIVWTVKLSARVDENTRKVAEMNRDMEQLERDHMEINKKLDIELVAIRERLVRIEVLLTSASMDIGKEFRR